MVNITKEKFNAYVRVQKGGLINMFDIRKVIELSGEELTEEDCIDIMENYSEYRRKYRIIDFKQEIIKGDKYIYLLMAVRLCLQHKLSPAEKASVEPSHIARIGEDNGMIGGQYYYRRFSLWRSSHDLRWILQETKTSPHFADFSKIYEVIDPQSKKPIIKEYFNESGENGSKNWKH